MANKIQIRRDTTANWTASDPILSQGELGLDTTLNKIKIGNGTSHWSALSFFFGDPTSLINGVHTVSLDDNGLVIFPSGESGQVSIQGGELSGHNGSPLGLSSNTSVVISTWNPALHSWEFTNTGGINFPTLSVDIHNGGVQSAQVLKFDDTTQQVIITGPTPAAGSDAQRIIIQGQRATGNGEGGDVYLWGGDSAVNGGDIKIYAGDGEASPSNGGYVNIAGGNGYAYGGDVTLTAGYASQFGGNVVLSAGNAGGQDGVAGQVTINASNHSWTFTNDGKLQLPAGGDIVNNAGNSITDIYKFAGGTIGTKNSEPTSNGWGGHNMYLDPGGESWASIFIPSVTNQDGGASLQIINKGAASSTVQVVGWGGVQLVTNTGGSEKLFEFRDDGKLTLPKGSIISETSNTVAIAPPTAAAGQSLVIRPTGVVDLNHVHLVAGDPATVDIYLGDDDQYVKIEKNAGDVVIGTNLDTHQWTFGTDSKLTLPNASTISPVAQVGYSYGPYASDVYNNTTGGDTNGTETFVYVGNTVHNDLFDPPVPNVTTTTGTIAANGDFDPGTSTGTFDLHTYIVVGGQYLGNLRYRDENNTAAGFTLAYPGILYERPVVTAGTLISGYAGWITRTPKTTTYIRWADGSRSQVTGSSVNNYTNNPVSGLITADDVSEKSFPATLYTANYIPSGTAIGVNSNDWKFGTDGKLNLPGAGYINTSLNYIHANYGISLHPTNNTGGTGPELYISYNDGIVIEPFTNDYLTPGNAASPLIITGSNLPNTNDSIGKLPGDIYIKGGHNVKDETYGKVVVNSGTNQWTFGTNGRTTFPNGAVPAHSYGAAGDKEGMVVFSDNYIYYCKQDYAVNSVNVTTLASTGLYVYVSSTDYAGDLVADFTANSTGWTYAAVSIISVAVDNTFGPGYLLEAATSFGAINGNDYALVSPVTPDIWKRVSWSGDTW